MSIFDGLFAEVNRSFSPTKTIGEPGTAIYGGFVQTNEINAALTGRQRYKTYSDIMANTSIVAAGVRYFLNLVAKASWSAEPADDTPQAKEFAERFEFIIDDLNTPWHRIVRRSSRHKFFGFSIQEWTAKRNDNGIIGFLDIDSRPQITIERWSRDDRGEVDGVIQRSPQTQKEIFLPRGKLVYLVDDALNDSPEGLGFFRHLVAGAQRLQRYEQLEGFGFETDLRGIPIGKGPFVDLEMAVKAGKLTPSQRDKLVKPLTEFIKNHIKNPELGLLLDSKTYESLDASAAPSRVSQWDMSILQGGSTSQETVARAIERLNRELARIIGVENLLLGGNAGGSESLSRDMSSNFLLIVDSTLAELEEGFEKDLINPIWELNGWPDEFKPKLKTEALRFRDVEVISRVLKDLSDSGAILDPNDPAIGEVRDLVGLSKPVMASLQTNGGAMVPDDQETQPETV